MEEKVIEMVDYDLLIPDNNNVRSVVRNIDELANSIEQHGLLQNLVVQRDGPLFVIVAGNRRYHAISKLKGQGKWQGKIPCLIVGDKTLPQLVENICRERVPVWDLGNRICEILEAGYTMKEIASRINKSHGYVCIVANIARGLAPETIEMLNSLDPSTFTDNQLQRLAKITKENSNAPDGASQIEMMQEWLSSGKHNRKHKAPVDTSTKATIVRRYMSLVDRGYKANAEKGKVIQAVLDYLGGKSTRLNV